VNLCILWEALECAHSLFFSFTRTAGSGKVKIKEPIDLAEKAMKQLSEAIDMAKSATN